MAAGGAVHRALETWDLFAGPEEEAAPPARPPARLPRPARRGGRRWTAPCPWRRASWTVSPRAAAAGPPARTCASTSWPASCRCCSRPRTERPVGFVSGTIDLLYRDPATGRLVVADYKTDDPETLEARVAVYAPQGATYVRALREALGLEEPPRFELWFLQADRVVEVGTSRT